MGHHAHMDHDHPPMEYSGKRADVVDHGGEYDYGGVEWFSEPAPARSQVGGPVLQPDYTDKTHLLNCHLACSTSSA